MMQNEAQLFYSNTWNGMVLGWRLNSLVTKSDLVHWGGVFELWSVESNWVFPTKCPAAQAGEELTPLDTSAPWMHKSRLCTWSFEGKLTVDNQSDKVIPVHRLDEYWAVILCQCIYIYGPSSGMAQSPVCQYAQQIVTSYGLNLQDSRYFSNSKCMSILSVARTFYI